jgi:hypothetical protein
MATSTHSVRGTGARNRGSVSFVGDPLPRMTGHDLVCSIVEGVHAEHVQDMWELLAKLEGEMTKEAGEARGVQIILLNNQGAHPLDPEVFREAARRKALEASGNAPSGGRGCSRALRTRCGKSPVRLGEARLGVGPRRDGSPAGMPSLSRHPLALSE